MTPEHLKAIREAAEAATPGPWQVSEHTVRGDLCMDAGAGWIFELYAMIDTHPEADVIEGFKRDAHHIATSNPETVIQLVDEVEALRGALKPFSGLCEKLDRMVVPEEGAPFRWADHEQVSCGIIEPETGGVEHDAQIDLRDLRRARQALGGTNHE